MTIDETTEQTNTLKADLTGYINVTVQEYEAMKGNGILVKVKEVEELLQEELQQARKEWLREEIEKLEGMRKKTNYPVSYNTSEGRKYTAMRDNHAGFNTCIDVLVGRYEAELNK